MPREYRYLLLDVFTEIPLAGNPLAVFLNGDGLSDAEMQALARETNLSETTFCFPDLNPGRLLESGIRVRIFTTEEELPFAGHPTLGTATALRWTLPELAGADAIKLRLNVGVVPVRFTASASTSASTLEFGRLVYGEPVYGEMEQPLPHFGQRHDPQAVAEALGPPHAALDSTKPIVTVSTGIPFAVVPLVSVEALQTLAVPQGAARAYLSVTDAKWFYILAPAAIPLHWRARMQFHGGEDPATGSAAGCAAAYLVHHGYAPSGIPLVLEQGVEISRRSVLHVQAVLQPEFHPENTSGWSLDSYVRVGGSTICVAEGRFFLS